MISKYFNFWFVKIECIFYCILSTPFLAPTGAKEVTLSVILSNYTFEGVDLVNFARSLLQQTKQGPELLA